jgi:hypothetical protein
MTRTEANIRARAADRGLDDAATGCLFKLRREVEALEAADRIAADIVSDLEARFAAVGERHGADVLELVDGLVYDHVLRRA